MDLPYRDAILLDLALYAIAGFGISYFATLVGLNLGLLRIPVTIILGLSPGVAAGTNMGVTAVSTLAGAWSHFREGRVDPRLMLYLGVPAMAGSLAGGFLGGFIAAWALQALIAAIVLWQGTLLVREGRREARAAQGGKAVHNPQTPVRREAPSLEAMLGLTIGFLGGMVGVALGTLSLPAMIRLLRVEPPIAVGSNLALAFLIGLAGMVGRLLHGQMDFAVLGIMGFAASVGAYYGARLTGRVEPAVLRMLIGVVLTLVSFLMFQQAYQRYYA